MRSRWAAWANREVYYVDTHSRLLRVSFAEIQGRINKGTVIAENVDDFLVGTRGPVVLTAHGRLQCPLISMDLDLSDIAISKFWTALCSIDDRWLVCGWHPTQKINCMLLVSTEGVIDVLEIVLLEETSSWQSKLHLPRLPSAQAYSQGHSAQHILGACTSSGLFM